jgi:methyl-accepting chemotaxis protein
VDAAADSAVAAAPPSVAAPAPSRRRRRLGGAGQVVGLIGLVLSLVLAFGALAGSLWLTGQVEDAAAAVDARLAEGQPQLDKLETGITEIKSTVDEVVAAADALAQASLPSDGPLATLQDSLGGLASRYAGLRNSYGDLKEKVTGALSSLQLLGRIIPGFTVPQEPLDALEALDTKVQELDASISGILETKFDGSALRDAAALVSEKVGKVSAGLDKVLGVVSDAGAKLAQARSDIAAAASQVTTLITVGGIVVMLLFLYIAFLHWVLYRSSRAARSGG